MWGQPPRLSRQAQRGAPNPGDSARARSSRTPTLLTSSHHHNRHSRSSRPGFILHCDRERLRFNCCRQRRIHHARAAMRIGLEHSRRNRRPANRNQPQLISLPRRQRRHVVRQENQAAAVPQIKCLALRLRRSLRRNQRHPLRLRRKNRRCDPPQIFQFAGALRCL